MFVIQPDESIFTLRQQALEQNQTIGCMTGFESIQTTLEQNLLATAAKDMLGENFGLSAVRGDAASFFLTNNHLSPLCK